MISDENREAKLKDLQTFLEIHENNYNSRRASLMHHFLDNVYVSVNGGFIVIKNILRSKKDALIVPFTPTESDDIINHTSASIIGAPVRKAMHPNHRIDLQGHYTGSRITTLTPAEAKFLAYTAYVIVYKDTGNSFRDSREILLIFTNYLLYDMHTTHPSQDGAQLLLKGGSQKSGKSQPLISYRITATDIIAIDAKNIEMRTVQRIMFNSTFKPFDWSAAIQNATSHEIKTIDELLFRIERHAIESSVYSKNWVLEQYMRLIESEEELEEKSKRGEKLKSYEIQTNLRNNTEFMRIPEIVDEIPKYTKGRLEEYLLQETGTLIPLSHKMPLSLQVLFRQCEVFVYDYRIKRRVDGVVDLQSYDQWFNLIDINLKGHVYPYPKGLYNFLRNEFEDMHQNRFPYNRTIINQRVRDRRMKGGKCTTFDYEAVACSVIKYPES